MANPTSADIFGPNFAVNAGSDTITFKYAGNGVGFEEFDMSVLNDTDAAADGRTVLYAILERVAAWYNALPTADRPANMRITSSGTLVDDGNGGFILQRTYSIVMKATAGALELIDEA